MAWEIKVPFSTAKVPIRLNDQLETIYQRSIGILSPRLHLLQIKITTPDIYFSARVDPTSPTQIYFSIYDRNGIRQPDKFQGSLGLRLRADFTRQFSSRGSRLVYRFRLHGDKLFTKRTYKYIGEGTNLQYVDVV